MGFVALINGQLSIGRRLAWSLLASSVDSLQRNGVLAVGGQLQRYWRIERRVNVAVNTIYPSAPERVPNGLIESR
jgi:hypothetical protein